MSSQHYTAAGPRRTVLALGTVSAACAFAFMSFQRDNDVLAVALSLGAMLAFMGSGLALYGVCRAPGRRFLLVALFSLLPLAYWLWVLLHPLSRA